MPQVYEDFLNKMQRMFPGLSGSSSDAGAISDAEKNLQMLKMFRDAGSGSVSDKEFEAYRRAIGGGGPISDRDAAAVRSQPVTRGALPPPTQLAAGQTSDQEAAALERAQAIYMQQMQQLRNRGGDSRNLPADSRAESGYRRMVNSGMKPIFSPGTEADLGTGQVTDREFQIYQRALEQGARPPLPHGQALTNFILNLNAKLRGQGY